MSEDAKATEQTKKSEPAKKSVVVTSEGGTTFARKPYAKGETIHCTAAQEEILKKQGVINS